MSYLAEVELGPSFAPFAAFRNHFGFVPALFRAQTLLPRVIEAEAAISEAVLLSERSLSRIQKELILLTLAAAHRNTYCVASHYQMLLLLGMLGEKLDQIVSDYRHADLTPADTALLDFAVKLGQNGPSISRRDVTGLFAHGWTDEAILEAIQTIALTNFLCTLSTGLGPAPDFAPRPIPSAAPSPIQSAGADESSGAYLRAPERSPEDFAPFAFFRERFGFVPNIFRAQTLRPDVLEAEASAIRAVLLTEDVLTRFQKECILLVVSTANLNTYCVAVHSEMLRAMGVSEGESDQIAVDHQQSGLNGSDKALLDFARRLAEQSARPGREDIDLLRQHGFTEHQILEAIVMVSLTNFLNTLQMGLGTTPDFAPRRVFRPVLSQKMDLSEADHRLSRGDVQLDPDADTVERVQKGDVDAFEQLVNRHGRRVYRTLVGILGNPEEARDAMQDTFLKAFQHFGSFQGRSKFSTWLVSIANNTGIQRLRERKYLESFDDSGFDSEQGFRPRQVQAWTDDPEQLYSQTEMRSLVEDSVMKLPAKYRVVLMLRDIEQLSSEEAAAALGLGIPALKARLLRGRLMLREALSPHFIPPPAKGTAKGVNS